jgi:voltage-gated potassium channel
MTTQPWRAVLERYWVQRRHTALLVAIVVALVVRPVLGDAGVGPLVFSLALLVLLLVALLTIQVDELVGERDVLLAQRRRRAWVGWALAAPAIAERLAVLVLPSPRLYVVGAVSWLLFFAFVTWSQLRTLLKHREVTGETISMSVSVYLMIGLTWGVFYVVLFELDSQAFNLGASISPATTPESQLHVFPTLVYFSLTTLSTVGFGDITPLTLPARYAAVTEAIAGQFYLTILVARLVGMQMSRLITPS